MTSPSASPSIDTRPGRCRAEHYSIRPISRRRRSAAQALAYATRSRIRCERTGRVHDHSRRTDLAGVVQVGWTGNVESLAAAMEAAERRCDARTGREIIIALPNRLSPPGQRDLVEGYAEWLSERYATPVVAAIHAPHGRALRSAPEQRTGEAEGEHGEALANDHVHLGLPARTWDTKAGAFGSKLKILDDRKTGPDEIKALRAEWARRASEALEREGIDETVDLRSVRDRIATGDLPEGTRAQTHLGPRLAGQARRREAEGTPHPPRSRIARNDRLRRLNEVLVAAWRRVEALRRLIAGPDEEADQEDETHEAGIARRQAAARQAQADEENDRLARTREAERARRAAQEAQAIEEDERLEALTPHWRTATEPAALKADPRLAELTPAERENVARLAAAIPYQDPVPMVLHARSVDLPDPEGDLEADLDDLTPDYMRLPPPPPPVPIRIRVPACRQRVRQLGD